MQGTFQLPPVMSRHGSLEMGVDEAGRLCVQFRSKSGRMAEFKCTSQFAERLAEQVRAAGANRGRRPDTKS